MSTISTFNRISDLNALLPALENDAHLLRPASLAERLRVLDELDALMGLFISSPIDSPAIAAMRQRALTLQRQLENANTQLYTSIRSKIIRGNTTAVTQWLEHLSPPEESTNPHPGLGFDIRDDFITSLFQQSEPRNVSPSRPREMIAYQPTPVRHVLRLLKLVKLSANDLFVDLGAGLGHVPLLVSILANIQSLGIEIEPAYVISAEESARSLHITNASFVASDAREADFSMGTVFYLYSPFTGSILNHVLRSMQRQSQHRPLKLCALGPCTRVLEKEQWLKPCTPPDPNQITLFESR